ncbi:hypothetical protein PISMIDRAFT_689618 [Pisolithus microcarpus 441]|uniref:Phosphofructokinase domain-containing protein n=1 Tax=Pisolithus microcarpus 441 TaxID=765257 RepID=A0A0C9XIW7_9AGAM|nr:phosphofructokinase domain-containing protein [Pisolithus microcarpus]KIK12280.1 hypothetical protein PISMIDRAFT_689618 [Pisolithus microcarpus 441]
MTEFSLGSDTGLNVLVDVCDVIKRSASASRNRVFVVETQGGQCRYIAAMVYTTDMLTGMFHEEGGGLFDPRYASLGHLPQGGVPTPMDRARTARLSLRCMAFLEEYQQSLLAQPPKSRCAPPESAAVITIQGSALKWVPVTEMVKHADMKNRRGGRKHGGNLSRVGWRRCLGDRNRCRFMWGGLEFRKM